MVDRELEKAVWERVRAAAQTPCGCAGEVHRDTRGRGVGGCGRWMGILLAVLLLKCRCGKAV